MENESADSQMKETLNALKELGVQTIIVYPNADAGGRKMINAIKKYENVPYFKIYKNIRHEHFISLMSFASVMAGNSSSGIIEAPSFGLPVVNIGTRQDGRERAGNIIDAGYNKEAIKEAIKRAMSENFIKKAKRCKNPYGDGRSSERIIKILSEIKIDEKLLQKRLGY
jgi:UDP-hydrolysing UDP-N-acetyl-D-glucosamine 2-epimerase